MNQELLAKSMAYAENNFLSNTARHLHVDKAFIKQHFNLKGKRVLDFGCGMGGMTLWLAQNGSCCEIMGLDIDGHHIAIANQLKSKHKIENVQFEKRDITTHPLPPQYEGSFDAIFLNDVVEHIPYPILEKIFAEFKRILTPKGRIFVSYPPWQSPYASHVVRVTKLPWCQFLPEGILLNWIEKKNQVITGEHESDLVAAYKGLNRLTHEQLMHIVRPQGFAIAQRLSHSLLRKLPILRGLNPNIFPFHFLISKELLILEKQVL
ncbi:MAG: class I SAM-dependent methyltransferase [Saprospiraceae bacterium]|nr:class I SAM-dependent methyltransferase [Saprospiraceae bacterium]